MPTARIEIEHVNKNWVVQVEASSILRSDRKTVYADTIEEAFTTALATYHEMEAKVRPQDEGKPRELTPELADAVARFKDAAAAKDESDAEEAKADAQMQKPNGPDAAPLLIATPEEAAKAIEETGLKTQTYPSGPAIVSVPGFEPVEIPSDLQAGETIEITPLPKRGRHPNACACEKCEAKRAAKAA